MPATPIPFTLIGGYLGSGKTTLLNRLLAVTDRRLVVLVNDVGAINVDAALVADHDGATMTLTNGCVCCAIADDLGPVLEQVRELVAGERPPEQVVMELSGVAEPARVAPWANTNGFRLDGIVVLADAEQVVELAARRFVGDTVRAQLSAADVAVLTKTDLVDDRGAAARAFVARHTAAPIVDAAETDPRALFGAGGGLPVAHAAGPVHRVEVRDLGPITFADLDQTVRDLVGRAVRAKGLIRCTDVAEPIEVHLVGRRWSLTPRPDRVAEPDGTSLVVVEPPAT